VRFVLVMIVLAAVLLALLHTGWGKNFVRGRIEARLAGRVNGSVSIGSLDYGFLFSSLELRDVVVKDASGTQALAVKSVSAVVDRGSVLDGTPIVERIDIAGVEIALVEGADGRSNLATLMRPSTGAPMASLTVKQLSVAGTVRYQHRDGTFVTVSDLAVTGTVLAKPGAQELAVDLAAMTATMTVVQEEATRVVPIALGPIRIRRGAEGTDIEVKDLSIAAASARRIEAHLALVDREPRGVQSLVIEGLRIDQRKLDSLLSRKLLVADVMADAKLVGPIEALTVHGTVATGTTTLALDGTVNLADRLLPQYDLHLSGTGKSEDLLVAPRPRMPTVATDIAIHLAGKGITFATAQSHADVKVGATTIGEVAVDGLEASVAVDRGTVELKRMRARGIGFEIGASGTLTPSGPEPVITTAADTRDLVLAGRLTVAGDPDDAIRVLAAAGIATPQRLPPLPAIDVAINAKGHLDGTIDLELDPTSIPFAGGNVAITGGAILERRELAGASTTLALRGVNIGSLARLAGLRPPLDGKVSGTVSLRHTQTTRTASYDLAIELPGGTLRAKGSSDGSVFTTTAKLRQAGIDVGAVTAKVSLDARGLVPTRPWRVTADLPERPIAELVTLLPPRVRAKLPVGEHGTARITVDLAGTPAAPRGTVDIAVEGPQRGVLHADLTPGARGRVIATTTGTIEANGIAAELSGMVSLPSIFRGRTPVLDPKITLDQTITVAERPLASLPQIPPKVAALGGTVGATVRVTGLLPDGSAGSAALDALTLDGQIAWTGYAMADGSTGETTIGVTGTPTKLKANIDYQRGAVSIIANVTHKADRTDIKATFAAAETPLWPLLPALLGSFDPGARGADIGKLAWAMTVDLGLAQTPTGSVIDRAVVEGTLDVRDGSLAIPDSARVWHDIDLQIAGAPEGIRLSKLELHESDRQLANRTLSVSGLVTLAGTKPQKAELLLEATDWLLVGKTSPIFTDAPTGALDLRARVEADLTTRPRAVDVTVESASFEAPNRQDRAHQPERASVSGDIIFVDAAHPPGRIPTPAREPIPALPPIDVRVHIPQPIKITRWPLDVTATGDLVISLGPDGVTPSGALELESGVLNLFAQDHELVRGTITVSRAHPTGQLDLRFKRTLPPESARDFADADVAQELHLTGSPSHPAVAFSGSAALLPEVFVTYNAGRSIYAPRPGQPATSTVQVPRGDQSNVLAFVSLAAQHLLVLDRVSAWADWTEARGAYGRIRNLEADRYVWQDRYRVRTVGRPLTPGRSTAELQLDRMFIQSSRAALGVGFRAGDRLGGGVGLVLEWSSRD